MARTRTPRAPLVVPRRDGAPGGDADRPRPTPFRRESGDCAGAEPATTALPAGPTPPAPPAAPATVGDRPRRAGLQVPGAAARTAEPREAEHGAVEQGGVDATLPATGTGPESATVRTSTVGGATGGDRPRTSEPDPAWAPPGPAHRPVPSAATAPPAPPAGGPPAATPQAPPVNGRTNGGAPPARALRPAAPVVPSVPPPVPPSVPPPTPSRPPAVPEHRDGSAPPQAPVPPVAGRPAAADRNGPLREIGASLRRRRGPVAGVVLLAAAGAAGLAVLFPPPTVATTSVQVGSVGTADPGPATARALAAAGSAAFTDRVAELTGSTAADLAGRLVVTAPEPGVLAVRATGTDAGTATALAGDAVTALRERIGALDSAVTTAGTAPLRAELDRRAADAQAAGATGTDPVADQFGRALADRTGQVTVVVDGPDPVAAPEVPTAWWTAGAAGAGALAALLLAGLGVPAVRRARGLLPEAHPDDRLRGRLDVPVLAPGSAPDAVPRLAGAYRDLLRGAERVTVVQLTREPACDVASELVKAAALVGDERGYRDLTPGAPRTPAPEGPHVRALRVPRLSHTDLQLLRDAGPAVLAVETAGTGADEVVTAVAALRAVGAPPLLCLVWPGRLPRDPARVPLPADARTRPHHP
ncbi:hypothetical protein [Pseudonocardia spirodelae]|uniref:Polysaccharide chain length determinant N-terminal domain-containing protein n=1 Tax=Pseudonocardia spirodelae TaxID=3133431 RepID=A0ABU8T1S4_9PSEU